jgi:hypothetical protein
LRVAGALLALALLGLSFRNVDRERVAEVLAGLGPRAVLLLVPSVIAVALEIGAWQRAFAAMDARASFATLFQVRVMTESVAGVLPLGAVWAETMKPMLLGRGAGFPLPVSLAGMTARKYLLVASQAGYLALGFFFGRRALERGFGRVANMPSLALVALGAAVALAIASEVVVLTLRGGGTFQALLARLAVVPWARFRDFLARTRQGAANTDGAAARFFALPRTALLALTLPCLAGWLLEATETWLILRSVGVGIGWGDALGIEALVVLSRHVLVFLPGGLGAQELGYAAFLAPFGSLDLCAAFVALKRLRELAWLAAGCALLAASRRGRDRAEERLAVEPG